MRISTGMIYDTGVGSMQRQLSDLLHTQQQLATGRRMLSPADDPVAAARALEVSQSQALNGQYAANQGRVASALGFEDSQLGAVTDVLQAVQQLTVQAGSGTLNDTDRILIAKSLRTSFDQILGLANATDATGQFLFSGYKGSVTPFGGTVATGVTYAGDDGRRSLQVSATDQIAVSDSGNDVFMRIRNGNGTFATDFASTNQGTAQIDSGNVLGSYNGHSYSITFSTGGSAGLQYSIRDTDPVTGASATTGPFDYRSGEAIRFDGTNTVTISGTPLAGGDSFTVEASSHQSVFDTLKRLITALETPTTVSNGGQTRIASEVSHALGNLSQVQDNVLLVRASVGSRMTQADALASLGSDLGIQYEQVLSQLQDVDYTQAISQLTRQQTGLDAAQKSFMRVTGLSLFNFL
jgi:flagellar hook-associated protein 3 FlgL